MADCHTAISVRFRKNLNKNSKEYFHSFYYFSVMQHEDLYSMEMGDNYLSLAGATNGGKPNKENFYF